MSEKIREEEQGESVDLNLATTEQIFNELARRYHAVLFVADGDVIGTNEAGDKCGEAHLEFKGNPFTLLGLGHFAMKEVSRSVS